MKKMVMMCAVVAAAICARAALPEGGPYTEVVDGIEWTFVVTNGEASVGTESILEPAISKETTGVISVPQTLGGRTVTSIGAYSFFECKGLTDVKIPLSVISIGGNAFSGCDGLGEGVVAVDNCLVRVGRNAEAWPSEIVIPQGIRLIADGTYSSPLGLYSPKSVSIPPSVKYIGEFAFSLCGDLTSVKLSEGLLSIGDYAFESCESLEQIELPSTLTDIGKSAFGSCDNLSIVAIPANVKAIGHSPFVSCKNLREISVEAGNSAYAVKNQLLCTKDGKCIIQCPGALKTVTIPASATEVLYHTFSGNSLISIAVETGSKSFSVRNQLLCNKDGSAVVACPGTLVNVSIPAGATRIEGTAFFGCAKLESVTIPSGVVSIDYCAFDGCDSLESVIIPASVKNLGNRAFSGSGLHSVIFAGGATSIGYYAFGSCHGLTSVSIPKSVTDIDSSAFEFDQSLSVVHVEAGDADRVREMLKECWILPGQITVADQVTIVEDYEPEPGPVPPEPEPEEGFEEAHTFNGLACAGEVMCGIVQVTTGKRTAKDQVKVGGFVMLTDGKKQTIKSVTEDVEGGKLNVETKAGKLGEMELEITDNGFTGSVGPMTVKSGDVGEDTGIISGTLKMSYFDAKTNKLKTRSIKLGGVASGGEAAGTLTTKGEPDKTFEAAIE